MSPFSMASHGTTASYLFWPILTYPNPLWLKKQKSSTGKKPWKFQIATFFASQRRMERRMELFTIHSKLETVSYRSHIPCGQYFRKTLLQDTKITMRNICQSMNYLGSEICGMDLWILQIEFLGNKLQISLPASNPILVEMRKRSFQTRLRAFIKWNTGNEQCYKHILVK